jgi:hypothetical protein
LSDSFFFLGEREVSDMLSSGERKQLTIAERKMLRQRAKVVAKK